jgi:hypothetical protein
MRKNTADYQFHGFECKVVITGHTRGIGKIFYEYYKAQGCQVVGFSRSKGFDISNEMARKAILHECNDANLFINVAFHKTGQLKMLEEITELWGLTDKRIVNISSKIAYITKITERTKTIVSSKRKQNAWVKKRSFVSRPRILNVVVGLIDTENSREIYEVAKMMPVEDLVQLVADLVKHNTINIQEIVVDVPNQDLSEIRVRENSNWSYEKWQKIA